MKVCRELQKEMSSRVDGRGFPLTHTSSLATLLSPVSLMSCATRKDITTSNRPRVSKSVLWIGIAKKRRVSDPPPNSSSLFNSVSFLGDSMAIIIPLPP